MPNKNTPPKHKTPNYKLISFRVRRPPNPFITLRSDWVAQPLRSNRKDLHS